jgi:hypothetical protein
MERWTARAFSIGRSGAGMSRSSLMAMIGRNMAQDREADREIYLILLCPFLGNLLPRR